MEFSKNVGSSIERGGPCRGCQRAHFGCEMVLKRLCKVISLRRLWKSSCKFPFVQFTMSDVKRIEYISTKRSLYILTTFTSPSFPNEVFAVLRSVRLS